MNVCENVVEVKPIIIWTLQRTGGTNLARHLFTRTGKPATQHEPFNAGRSYGHVTDEWNATHDRAALDGAMAAICEGEAQIKHCVETVPWEISEALAQGACRAGYAHLFLYRRASLDRLLSLHYARQSGIWGPEYPDGADRDKRIFAEPLPVEELVRHERRSTAMLSAVWRLLVARGATPLALAYEDIYQEGDSLQATRALLPVLQALGLAQGEGVGQAFVEQLVSSGEQGTREAYRNFSGLAELKKRLGSVPRFAPDLNSYAPLLAQRCAPHPWVLHAAIDVLPQQVMVDEPFDFGGVVVLSDSAPAGCRLTLCGAPEQAAPRWELPSQRMEREYPGGSNAAAARFEARASMAAGSEAQCLALQAPDGTTVPLCELLLQAPPDHGAMAVEPEDRLIFDVGANDGADSWYYLSKGFRVVAVEAIPALADALAETLAPQVAAGRLAVARQAIAAQAGEVTFTVNDDWTEWSSLFSASKASAGKAREIRVPAGTMAQLIERHGVPYYVKIDIEGGEFAAVASLQALSPAHYPPLISVEVNPLWPQLLQLLGDLGYTGFQLVRQGSEHLPGLPRPSREGLDRRVAFNSSMSGPFGRDLPPGRWVGLVEIVRQVVDAQAQMDARRRAGTAPGWYDVHAARPQWLQENGIAPGAEVTS